MRLLRLAPNKAEALVEDVPDLIPGRGGGGGADGVPGVEP